MNNDLLKYNIVFEKGDDLRALSHMSDEELAAIDSVAQLYPMRIPLSYYALIDENDPEDPIARMCIPSMDELDPSGSDDTSGESDNTKQTGIQHKYRQTALILTTNECAMYCRHCFRKRLVGISDDELNKQADEAVKYIRKHPEINNVLLSGGDALMLPNRVLRRYLSELSDIDTLDFIRIGSRVPAVLPRRISEDAELLDMLDEFGKKKALCLVTQFNHPRELAPDQTGAVRCLRDRAVQVRNQTVLLKGVNDDKDVLGDLLRGLTKYGITPYYVFQCRPVRGVKGRFQVPLLRGTEIVDDAKAMQNGPGKSLRYIMSHPRGKIEILGTVGKRMLFKFHQSKSVFDDARIFSAKLSANHTWLDDNLNGI